jgi:hypothetical protein
VTARRAAAIRPAQLGADVLNPFAPGADRGLVEVGTDDIEHGPGGCKE